MNRSKDQSMRTSLSLVFIGAGLLGACTPPTFLVQPADPNLAVRAPRYTNVVAGVKRFDVVDPKDWRALNRAVAPKPGEGGMGGMPGMGGMGPSKMPGMNGKSGQGDMRGMPGMGKSQGDGGKGDASMPGMNMPGMGGKRDTRGR